MKKSIVLTAAYSRLDSDIQIALDGLRDHAQDVDEFLRKIAPTLPREAHRVILQAGTETGISFPQFRTTLQ
jgi:hypothetical protein